MRALKGVLTTTVCVSSVMNTSLASTTHRGSQNVGEKNNLSLSNEKSKQIYCCFNIRDDVTKGKQPVRKATHSDNVVSHRAQLGAPLVADILILCFSVGLIGHLKRRRRSARPFGLTPLSVGSRGSHTHLELGRQTLFSFFCKCPPTRLSSLFSRFVTP